jgi:TatD DNase family protein
MWADTHCHLDTLNEQEISRAVSADVTRFAVAGVTGCTKEAEALAEHHEEVFLMAGIHPLYIDTTDRTDLDLVHQIAATQPKCVAIGEIGLDYSDKDVDRDRQMDFFRRQLEFANDLNLPVSIHLRRAFPDFLEIIKSMGTMTVVMHMYSGSSEFARQLQQVLPRVFFSFGGPATRTDARKTHSVLRTLPFDRILVETDSPDLPPPGMPSPNVPANLPRIGAGIAAILDMGIKDFETLTWNNAREVFQW